jgi:hypothetical protein
MLCRKQMTAPWYSVLDGTIKQNYNIEYENGNDRMDENENGQSNDEI